MKMKFHEWNVHLIFRLREVHEDVFISPNVKMGTENFRTYQMLNPKAIHSTLFAYNIMHSWLWKEADIVQYSIERGEV